MPNTKTPYHLRQGEFFGNSARCVNRNGFTYSDTRYPPGLEIPEHFHDRSFFHMLVQGSCWGNLGRQWKQYEPGAIVFHPSREVHRASVSTAGGRCFLLEVGSQWEELADSFGGLPSEQVVYEGGSLHQLGLRLFNELAGGDTASPLVMEGIALELIGRVVRRRARLDRRPPPWISDVAERLRAELCEPLTVKGLAADLGVSPLRLSREFRRTYGESVGEMQRRLRIDESCRRLGEPEARLADIAADVGFADQSHFNRVFRKALDMTPAAYRRLMVAS